MSKTGPESIKNRLWCALNVDVVPEIGMPYFESVCVFV